MSFSDLRYKFWITHSINDVRRHGLEDISGKRKLHTLGWAFTQTPIQAKDDL